MRHSVQRAGYLVASAFVVLSLSGCISQSTINQNQSGAVSAGGSTLAHPTPSAPARPSGPQVTHKTVIAGQTQNFGTIMALNPDCSNAGTPTLKIKQAPVHGTAQIVTHESYPTYPASNPRSACNSMKLPGVSIDYTPAQGFTGTDYMTVDIITTTGTSGVIIYSITVE